RLDHPPSPKRGCSRSLVLADRRRLLATVVGSSPGQRRAPAMGTPSNRRLVHSGPSPAALHRNFGPGGYSSSCTSQAGKIARTSEWTTSEASTPLRSRPPTPATNRLISQFL